jgi:zinc transport system ATP-binding protein
MTRESVLSARQISFAYDGARVLEDVGFDVYEGEFVALVGPNGAGKSTLIRILLGLLAPDAGEATVLGAPALARRHRWRVGYVPQRVTLARDLPATVREVVATGRLGKRGWWRRPRASDHDAVEHFVSVVGLGELIDRPVRELSGGQQQRALIARALVCDPTLLILDEPIAGVDADAQRLFRDALAHAVADHGAAVFLVSHELGAVADSLDRVIVLKRSIVFDGTPRELAREGVSLGVHAQDLPLWLEGLR